MDYNECEFMVFMSAKSKQDLEAAIADFEALYVVDVHDTHDYFTEFGVFEIEKDARAGREMFRGTTQGVVFFESLVAFENFQRQHPNVFVAAYCEQSDAEAGEVGMVMTGIHQWRLVFADLDVMMHVDQQATGKSGA